jgi:hypothetical protein
MRDPGLIMRNSGNAFRRLWITDVSDILASLTMKKSGNPVRIDPLGTAFWPCAIPTASDWIRIPLCR